MSWTDFSCCVLPLRNFCRNLWWRLSLPSFKWHTHS
jgi:hypothetical protein